MKSEFATILSLSLFLSVFGHRMRSFPEGFQFGVATAAYQIEGAWNVSDKSENIWDYMTHNKAYLIRNEDTGDDAVKSYQYFMRDVEKVEELGVDFYRFSISWSRLLPTGFTDHMSEDGLKYYNSLINALLERDITPVVTIYHWDLPQRLQDLGGWANPIMADYYKEYARVCFREFGDRVKTWLTFNEPRETCLEGYGEQKKAPALGFPGVGEYLCSTTLIRAHGMAYRLYDKEFRSTQNGRVGLTISTVHVEPADDEESSILGAEILTEFHMGWFANPIYSKEGDYPAIMKERIAERSREQNLSFSRLPTFSKDDIDMIKGSYDFFGMNHYTTVLARLATPDEFLLAKKPSFEDDNRAVHWQNASWPQGGSPWLKVVPWGFRKILNHMKNTYGNPEIMVFENGYSTSDGQIDDADRIDYLHSYMNAMLDAIEIDKVNVTAYTVWSLMDNFEWAAGYSEYFGLYATNYSDPERSLTPKESAKFYSEVVKSRKIPAAY